MNIRQHPSEHSVGIESQNNDNVSNENQIDEVRHTLIWIVTSRITTQRSVHPFTLARIFHGDLPSQSIPRNDHDNWKMLQK